MTSDQELLDKIQGLTESIDLLSIQVNQLINYTAHLSHIGKSPLALIPVVISSGSPRQQTPGKKGNH